jgi:DNA polymerase-3 subunit epsilon
MYLFFDTETTGFTKGTDPTNTGQPHLVQLGAILADSTGKVRNAVNVTVEPDNYEIPTQASNVHGITTELAIESGISRKLCVELFSSLLEKAEQIVCHNFAFDNTVIRSQAYRENILMKERPFTCTMSTQKIVDFCAIPPTQKMIAAGRRHYKTPNLTELHIKCFGKDFGNAHNAMADVKATMNCFFYLKEQKVI